MWLLISVRWLIALVKNSLATESDHCAVVITASGTGITRNTGDAIASLDCVTFNRTKYLGAIVA